MTQTLSGSAGATAARVRERAASTTGQGTPHQLGYIITGGEDHKLRFWDLGDADGSAIICGADEGEDKGIAYSRGKVGSCSTFTETRPVLKSIPSGPNRRQTLVANNQQTLLKAHQDAITAIALLELPFRCIVSADRSGVIKVWE
jgi:phosphoinositide-3-kinase regulatory subunit 4